MIQVITLLKRLSIHFRSEANVLEASTNMENVYVIQLRQLFFVFKNKVLKISEAKLNFF